MENTNLLPEENPIESNQHDISLDEIMHDEMKQEIIDDIHNLVQPQLDELSSHIQAVQEVNVNKSAYEQSMIDAFNNKISVIQGRPGDKGTKGDRGDVGVSGLKGPKGDPGTLMTPDQIVEAINKVGGVDYKLVKGAPSTDEMTNNVMSRMAAVKGYLFEMSDVDTSNKSSGKVLAYNSTTDKWEAQTSGGGSVTSVFGRTGVVTATSGDYTAAQITNVPAGNISATNVQAALNELDTEVVHLAGVETITGNKTFTGTVTVPTPVANTDASTKAYADSLVLGLWDDRGSYDASVNSYPATGGSGTAGAVLKGDIWTISVPGILGGVSVSVGDTVRAIIDTPGQVAANWATLEGNLGYTPVTNARTINTLPLSADQTFATGTTGTDFNIVSAGTVHTYNIPSASATARGLVSIVAQSFASVKTFIASTIFSTGSQYTVTTNATLGATPTFNFATTAIHNGTLTASVTAVTFTAPTLTAGNYARLQIKLNTGAGGFTATGWPAVVKWAGGTAPTITATAAKSDVITMVYDGTNYFATVSQNF